MRDRMNDGGLVARLLIAVAFVASAVTSATRAQAVDLSHVPQIKETAVQRDARMQWWRDAKFGMFLHWGPVSLSGKELSWGRNGSRPWDISGVQNRRIIDPVYDNLYRQFNPVKFNADQWVKIAQDAGMKVAVHGFLCCDSCVGFWFV